MELCDDGHAQICHDENNCPVCVVIDEKNALETKVDTLERNVDSLQDELANVE